MFYLLAHMALFTRIRFILCTQLCTFIWCQNLGQIQEIQFKLKNTLFVPKQKLNVATYVTSSKICCRCWWLWGEMSSYSAHKIWRGCSGLSTILFFILWRILSSTLISRGSKTSKFATNLRSPMMIDGTDGLNLLLFSLLFALALDPQCLLFKSP